MYFVKISLVMVAILAILFGIQYLSLTNFNFFAPKWQESNTEVWKNTSQYTDSTRRDLEDMYIQYQLTENENVRQSLKSIMLRRSSAIDPKYIPVEIQQLIKE